MNKEEAIKLIVKTKAISPFTRNFVEWVYRNNYVILSPEEYDEMLDEASPDAFEVLTRIPRG